MGAMLREVVNRLMLRASMAQPLALIWDAERKLGDHHVLKRVPLDVYALPKTRGSKQHTTRIGFETIQ